jgi:uncharacterized protein YbgA (DUF1722 family)/uncharacterized protein YbbK (DUF523 family)
MTIRLGVSACLLGRPVRYDGGHRLDQFLVGELGRFVEYMPVCPEAEAGLGVPREAMRLVGDPACPRLVTVRTHEDRTDQMTGWAERRVRELEAEDLCGFIFKKDSPSSGLMRVKVYAESGMPIRKGIGMFARAFVEHFPTLPVEEEGRLNDADIRENFIERVFTLKRWREQVVRSPSRAALVRFHSTHKLLLMAHSPEHYRATGPLVAEAKAHELGELLNTYQGLLLEALALRATPRRHVNVLHHIMGYFKRGLTADEKQELLEVIETYRAGLVPLIVPITLLNHYVRRFEEPYLAEQVYLHPHPLELKLRNHV